MSGVLAEYLRLSLDDGTDMESNSISAQREIIRHYITTKPELAGLPLKEYSDDGYSGTNFERPDMKRMLEDVRTGKVSCVIVKDLSRFGREFIEAGKYIELIFPLLGVRFISVNDHFDSDKYKGKTAGLDIAVRNLINSLYSKDVSKKVTTAKRTKMARAEFANSQAIYGYQKSKQKGKLEIDETAAEVVRRIFELAQSGVSTKQIAVKLNQEGIPAPSAYKTQSGERKSWNTANDEVFWKYPAVLRILKDERYTGVFIAGMTQAGALGSNTRIKQNKSDWVRISNALPAIIEPEVYQEVKARLSRGITMGEPQKSNRILYRKLKCGHCNHYLYYKNTSVTPYFYCDTAKYDEHADCFSGKLIEKDILLAISEALKAQTLISGQMMKSAVKERNRRETEIAEAQKKLNGLSADETQKSSQKRELYEQFKSGKLDKAIYLQKREEIESDSEAFIIEKQALTEQLETMRNRLSEFDSQTERLCNLQFDGELNRSLVDALIEEIIVYDEERIEIRFAYADIWKELH